jgi:F420-dependent oxidoreductase-like protein
MVSPLFGYHMPNFSFGEVPPAKLFQHVTMLARAAEAAGFDLITVMDHFYQIRPVGPETEPMLEAYTTLSALAASTSRVKLGTLVTGVTYRNPALLAKMVTTIDIISEGRAVLGIGAAWNQDEHIGYGYEFPPVRERMDRLQEALTIAKRMFTEDRPSFSGRYYRIERAINSPQPVQPGGPKILVGGGGEQRTLRIAARFADMTHWFIQTVDEFKHKSEVLEQHCKAVGRDPSTILRTIGAPVTIGRDTQEQAAEKMHEFMRAGVGGFTFRNPNLTTPELLDAAGRIKKLLA